MENTKYESRELHATMLRILMAFDKVCKQHNLRYGIIGGSLIGAVRHKGFIPWDDDLDVFMPRPDYEKFIVGANKWLESPYEFVCAENDSNYPLQFGKIQDSSTTLIERRHLYYLGGIYIDVFPFDSYPDGKWTRWRTLASYRLWKQILYHLYRNPYRHGKGLDALAHLALRKIVSKNKAQRKLRDIAMRNGYERGADIGNYNDSLRGVLPRRLVENLSDYEFCGERVKGFSDYDAYLSSMYGDYMKIPAPENRIRHNFNYVDLSSGYSQYKE